MRLPATFFFLYKNLHIPASVYIFSLFLNFVYILFSFFAKGVDFCALHIYNTLGFIKCACYVVRASQIA